MSGATARARATSRPAYVREDVRPLLTVVKANQPRRSVIPMTFVALEKASPVELEKAAKAQGMVHAGKLGTIRLADGQVEGGVAAR